MRYSMKPLFHSLFFTLSWMACSRGFANPSAAASHTKPTSITQDVGSSIEDIFEYDKTSVACGKYWSFLDESDQPKTSVPETDLRREEVLCGKWLFLSWETTGKLPLPELLFDAIQRSWPERVGTQFEKLGFLPNPFDKRGRPLGVTRSTTKYTGLPAVNISCSACHVGQLPDGRFSVGAPNTKLDMSTFNLMSYFPLFATMSNQDRALLHPEVRAYYLELERTEKNRIGDGKGGIDWSNVIFKYSKLLRWLHIGAKGLPDAKYVVMPPERDLLSWIHGKPGVFNPGAPMLTLQVEGVPNLAVPQIWGVSGFEQDFANGKTAPVGQTTKYSSLEKFAADALIYAYQDPALNRPRNIRPLVAYLRQIETPKTLEVLDPASVVTGQTVFNHSCKSCHDGASGESTKIYGAHEVDSIAALENPRAGYEATTPISKLIAELSDTLGARIEPQPIGIKSRRLTGLWARKNLMTHGSVKDIDDLLCLKGSRSVEAFTHQEICSELNFSERQSLLSYLKTL